MKIKLITFGFEYGCPKDIPYIVDARGVTNPYYDKRLRSLSGCDIRVRNRVLRHPIAKQILDRCIQMVNNSSDLETVIGIGCTGGNHRSVSIAMELEEQLSTRGHIVKVFHRDLQKEIGYG